MKTDSGGRPSALTAKRIETTNLDALWADLASSDVAKAHRAICTFSAVAVEVDVLALTQKESAREVFTFFGERKESS